MGVFAITIFRYLQGDMVMVLVDTIIITWLICVCFYSYIARNINISRIVLILFGFISVTATVYLKGATQLSWIFPIIVTTYFILPLATALIINTLLLVVNCSILSLKGQFDIIIMFAASSFATCVITYFLSLQVQKKNLQLKFLATKDALTNTGNRHALNEKLDQVVNQLKSVNFSSSLILIDLDNFKKINDSLGHLIGDTVLVAVAHALKTRLRESDRVYRYGGEEFVVLPYELSLEDTAKVAEDLRKLVSSLEAVDKHPLTISLGVAKYKSGETPEQWLGRADKALYTAKNTGKDKVVCAE